MLDETPITSRRPFAPASSGPGRIRYDSPIGAAALPAIQKAILNAVKSYFTPGNLHEGREWSYLSLRTLAQASGVPERSITRHVPLLVELGVLLRLGSFVDGQPVFNVMPSKAHRYPTVWAIDFDKLTAMAGERPKGKPRGGRPRTPPLPKTTSHLNSSATMAKEVTPVPSATVAEQLRHRGRTVTPPWPNSYANLPDSYATVADKWGSGEKGDQAKEKRGRASPAASGSSLGVGGTQLALVPEATTPASAKSRQRTKAPKVDKLAPNQIIAAWCEGRGEVVSGPYAFPPGAHTTLLTAIETFAVDAQGQRCHTHPANALAWLKRATTRFFTERRDKRDRAIYVKGGDTPGGFLNWRNSLTVEGDAPRNVARVRVTAQPDPGGVALAKSGFR